MQTISKNPTRKLTGKPVSIVALNGHQVKFLDWRTENTTFHASDSFEVNMPFRAIDGIPAPEYLRSAPYYASRILTDTDVLVEIYAGYTTKDDYTVKDLTKVMHGYLDTSRFNFSSQGEKVTIVGRNLIGKMLDHRTTEKYLNKTGSQLAHFFADKYRLKFIIDDTYTPLGTYYNQDHAKLTDDSSEWDLLLYAAENDGCIVRVYNDTLYYGSIDDVTKLTSSETFKYSWGYDIEDITFEKSPYASRDIEVEVTSWQGTKKTRISEKVRRKRTGTGTLAASSDKYYFRYYIPGLTKDQAIQRAQTILEDLSRREIIGTMRINGNEKLSPDRKISIDGVGNTLSTEYYIARLTSTFNSDTGYKQEIAFCNSLSQDDGRGI